MNENLQEEYDMGFYPLTDLFEKVTESNYLQFVQIANVLYHYLLFSTKSHGYHFVNWRVNFGNLHDFVTDKQKVEKDVKDFMVYYDESAPILYQKLGLEY